MEKVWIVISCFRDRDTLIEGVFGDAEAAEEYARWLRGRYTEEDPRIAGIPDDIRDTLLWGTNEMGEFPEGGLDRSSSHERDGVKVLGMIPGFGERFGLTQEQADLIQLDWINGPDEDYIDTYVNEFIVGGKNRPSADNI